MAGHVTHKRAHHPINDSQHSQDILLSASREEQSSGTPSSHKQTHTRKQGHATAIAHLARTGALGLSQAACHPSSSLRKPCVMAASPRRRLAMLLPPHSTLLMRNWADALSHGFKWTAPRPAPSEDRHNRKRHIGVSKFLGSPSDLIQIQDGWPCHLRGESIIPISDSQHPQDILPSASWEEQSRDTASTKRRRRHEKGDRC